MAKRTLRQIAARKAARKRANNAELSRIEEVLDEEFSSLKEARAALKKDSEVITKEPKTLKEYITLYNSSQHFEDQGEVEGGADY